MTSFQLQVLNRIPHPARGFTQGLIVNGSTVWESTGMYGESALRRYQLGNKEVEQSVPLNPDLFGEGICQTGRYLWQLTWRERVALRWDPQAMELLETVPYNREGWGICQVGDRVVTSDGSSELVWRDPEELSPLGLIKVRLADRRLDGLNDLTWDGARIWANILSKRYLAAIDPASGQVTDMVDARGASERYYRDPNAVMNGISALSPGEFVLTGKRWRSLYHARLAPNRRGELKPERLLARY
ncbi:MAG: glutaminyl-peptide cyclotransferase [Nocardiopsaceae bacterium]|jgi:glutamine cyclotransferase|nr:glutaminyl-peptide cyclotransferase [Nocardiopsaceae bacterium]